MLIKVTININDMRSDRQRERKKKVKQTDSQADKQQRNIKLNNYLSKQNNKDVIQIKLK